MMAGLSSLTRPSLIGVKGLGEAAHLLHVEESVCHHCTHVGRYLLPGNMEHNFYNKLDFEHHHPLCPLSVTLLPST